MNNIHSWLLAVCAALALPALALPAVGHAEDSPASRQAAQNCSQALASQMRMHLVAHHYVSAQPDPDDVFTRPNELTLTAVSPTSGRIVATAVCYYTRAGSVRNLAVYPPDQLLPEFMETGP